MEEVSVNYAGGEYIKKRCKSAHERLLWCLNLDCVFLCLFFVFFLSIYGLQQHRKGGKAHERLLSSLSLHLRHRR